MKRFLRISSLLAVAMALAHPAAAADEAIKIGIFRGTSSGGPLFIAKERGYFAAEGLAPEFETFDAGEAVAVATVAGAIDFGAAGTSAALYNLAAQGKLRVISGMNRDVPGFQAVVLVASGRAYAAGLTGFANLPGHSVALTTMGSTFHYVLGLVEDKFGFDAKSIRVVAAQGLPNVASTVIGGQTDTGIFPTPFAAPLLERGEVKLVGYAADVAPWQVGILWSTTDTANDKRALVERMLRAFRRGVHDYHDAFTGAGETRQDGPAAPEILAIIAKYINQSPAQVARGISYIDGEARIDARDVQHQIDWYRAQGMLKGELDAKTLIDARYAPLLSETSRTTTDR